MTLTLSNNLKKWAVIVFKTALTGYLIWFVFKFVDWYAVIDSLKTVKISFVILAFLLMIPNIFFHWLKWDYLIRLLYPTIKKRRTFFSALSGITLDTMFISTAGDYAGKILGLNDVPRGSVVALNFFDKLQLLAITILAGSVSFIILGQSSYFDSETTGLLFWIGSASLVAGLLLSAFCIFPKFYISFIKLISRYKSIHTADAFQAAQILRNEDAFYIFFVNGLKFFTFNTQFYLVLLSFDYLTIYHAFLGTTAMFFAKSVLAGVSLSDIGSRGASSVFFFTKLGIASSVAINVALLVFIINRLIPSLCGFIVVLFLDIKYNPVKRRLKLYNLRKIRKLSRKIPTSQNQL